MEIVIIPELETVKEDMGLDPWEDVNEDALLFQQGCDIGAEEIFDGESFTVADGYYVGVTCDGETYYVMKEIDMGVWEKVVLDDYLRPGRYRLDGDTIYPRDYDKWEEKREKRV